MGEVKLIIIFFCVCEPECMQTNLRSFKDVCLSV